MAKKNVDAGSQTARQKAKQMRTKQAKADKRTRDLIIAIVTALALAIVVAIVVVIVNRPVAQAPSDALPEQFQQGEPIAVSSEGVGVTNPDVGDLYMYFDYTCAGCVTLDYAVGSYLTEAASDGEFNLMYQPVLTAGGPYNTAAAGASVLVAAYAPDSFIAFHKGLIDYYANALQTQDGSGVNTAEAALETVSEIARDTGVPEDVVATFNNEVGTAYLTASTNDWVAKEVNGRDRTASPELVYNGTKISPTGNDGAEMFASLQTQITELSN